MDIVHKSNTGKHCKKLTLQFAAKSDYEQNLLAEIRNAILSMGDLSFFMWLHGQLTEAGYIEVEEEEIEK